MEFLQQNLFWIALAVGSAVMLLWRTFSDSGRGVSVSEATLLINRQDALVIDVRETAEWSGGHVPDSRHIALGHLGSRLSEVEKYKERPLIVVCATGARSGSACATLRKAGFQQVFNLSGGMRAWSDAGLPTSKK